MGKGKGSMSLEQECCPICGKVVYDAESYPAGEILSFFLPNFEIS